MLTSEVIRNWLRLRASGMAGNDYALAAAARHDKAVAEAWRHSPLIDELVDNAKLVKKGLASKQFAERLHERIARETDGPDAAAAIWDAALRGD